jgi:CubicO group peptidase (beta-lactamase class C family)
MHKHILIAVFTTLAVVLLAGLGLGQPMPPAAERARVALADLAPQIEAMRAAWNVPGLAVAVVVDGNPVFLRGFGMRDRERKLPVTSDTLFSIASATKAFTTFAMAQLVDEGTLNWELPVRSYIPWFQMHDPVLSERLTALDLVTHRSGLPRHDALWYNTSRSRTDLVHQLRHLELSAGLRQRFQYNNLMFVTAGYLIEVLGGKSWERAIAERIFAPLKMKRAQFSVAASQRDRDHAEAYREEKDGAIRHIPQRNVDAIGPAGSINASIGDLVPWLQVHLGDGTVEGRRLIAATSLRMLHTSQMTLPTAEADDEVLPIGYAPGWFVDSYRGVTRVHHGGNLDGMSAMVMLVPEHRLGIAILANLERTRLRDVIPKIVIDRVLGLVPRGWSDEELAKRRAQTSEVRDAGANKQRSRKPNAPPAHPLLDYVGDYEHPGYGVATVSAAADGKSLRLSYNGLDAPLQHWHFESWRCGRNESDPALEDTQLMFETSYDGEVAGLQLGLEPNVADIRFLRRPDRQLINPRFLRRLVGRYRLATSTVDIELRGTTLVLAIERQPVRALTPRRGTSFAIEGVSGQSVSFEVPGSGSASALTLEVPEGRFTAKRQP